MILEVALLSPPSVERLRLRYYPFPVNKKDLKLVVRHVKKLKAQPDIEPPLKNMQVIVMECSDGRIRKFGVALDGKNAVVIIGDELEDSSSLRIRATNIIKELSKLDSVRNIKKFTRAQFNDLVSIVNEIVYQYMRIALFGLPSTGKTSLFELVRDGPIVTEYIPTSSVDQTPAYAAYQKLIEDVDRSENEWYQIANRLLVLYDLPGLKKYRRVWKTYLTRADAAALVLNSTKKGVIEARKLMGQYRSLLPPVVIAIANFQDLEDALAPVIVSRFLGIETYGTVAVDPDMRDVVRGILQTAAVLSMELNVSFE